MKIIDAAIAHYRELVDHPREIAVPEWQVDGKPVVLYSTPLTAAERVQIQKYAKGDLEIAVETIILKAKTKDGVRAFGREDKQSLLRSVDSGVLIGIATRIFAEYTEDDVAGLEKNSPAGRA